MAGHLDLTGLTIAVAAGTVIATIGAGIDSLLLSRHVKALDVLALKWWFFFDNLRIADIPRMSVSVYVKGKNKVLGRGFTPIFFLRSFLLSLVLTTISVPGGRALGLYLLLRCNEAVGLGDQHIVISQIFQAAWSWSGPATLAYLVPINIIFDLTTIFITIIILSKALSKPDYFLLALIILDILACVILFYNAVFIADQFDNASTIAINGYWLLIPTMLGTLEYGCTAYHVLTSKLLFISTILLPTLIYLVMIVALFILREGFKIFKFTSMYVLEKSVEDKKTIFAHLGTTIGLLVAVGKATIEIVKII